MENFFFLSSEQSPIVAMFSSIPFVPSWHLFKFNNGNRRKMLSLFEINNEDTETTSLTLFWCLYCKLWTDFYIVLVFQSLALSNNYLLSVMTLLRKLLLKIAVLSVFFAFKRYLCLRKTMSLDEVVTNIDPNNSLMHYNWCNVFHPKWSNNQKLKFIIMYRKFFVVM